jgi:hypothetical protein
MFYYKKGKKSKLEVSIAESYSDTDLKRIFLFIDALINNSKAQVVFKVSTAIATQFKKSIENLSWHPVYVYKIKESLL